jgi:hypothetical protein
MSLFNAFFALELWTRILNVKRVMENGELIMENNRKITPFKHVFYIPSFSFFLSFFTLYLSFLVSCVIASLIRKINPFG